MERRGRRAAAILVVVAVFCGLGGGARGDEPIVLLASEQWTGPDALSLATLRQLYLGRRTRLAGTRVRCFDLPSGSEVRRGFARTALQKTERELEDYWIEQALTGGYLPPRELASAEEMIREVARRKRALGYVGFTSYRTLGVRGVRVLAVEVDGEALFPSSPEYPIRYDGGEGGVTEKALDLEGTEPEARLFIFR